VASRAIALLAAVAFAAALAGCGGTGSPDGAVAAAAVKTEHAGGVKVKLTVSFMVAGLSSGALTGTGTFDRDVGDMTIDLSDIMQLLPLPVGTGGGIREIYLHENGDPVVYMQIPFLAGQLPDGKSWVRLDLQQAGIPLGLDVSSVLGQSGSSPAQTLDLLRAAGTVQKVGPDDVGGVNVTRYHALVDLKKALKQKGVAAGAAQSVADAGAPTNYPVDVWIGNDDGLVHQLRLTESRRAAGRTVSSLTTMTLSGWGTPVSEQAPPADQVFDATALASKQRKA
jgi:hypothetical protein